MRQAVKGTTKQNCTRRILMLMRSSVSTRYGDKVGTNFKKRDEASKTVPM